MERTSDIRFFGMDTRTDPERLPPGFCQDIRNYLTDGLGSLVSRDAFEGLFTTPLPGPIYEPTSFEQEGSATWIVFVSGGKLYKTQKGSSAYTEILDGASSFAFPNGGRDVRMVRFGNYAYGVPGSGGGALFRTNLTTGESVTGLATPATAPAARLIAPPLDSAATAANWSSQAAPASMAQLLVNSSFEDTIPSDLDGWNTSNPTFPVESKSANGHMTPKDGVRALLLDEAANFVEQEISPPALGTSPTEKCRVYRLQTSSHTADDGGKASMEVLITALDSGGATLQAADDTYNWPANGPANQWRKENLLVAFNGLALEPTNMRVRLQGGPENPPGEDDGWYVDYARLDPVDVHLMVSNGALPDEFQVTVVATAGASGEAFQAALGATAGQFIKRTYALGDEQDWEDVTRIAIPIRLHEAILAQFGRPRFRIGLQAGTGDVVWSEVCTYNADGTSISADVTTIDSAIRGAVRYLWVQILDDLGAAAVSAGGSLFVMGRPVSAGALTVGSGYYWLAALYRQVGSGTPDIVNYESIDNVQSSGSPLTEVLTALPDRARAELVLPDATGSGATHYLIFRGGGAFAEDGFLRIIAIVPVGSSIPEGDGYTWDEEHLKFTDDTGDSRLFGRRIYQINRDAFPSGCTAIMVHQGRLWTATGNTVFASWLLSEGVESGLYTSNADDPTDPSRAIKGAKLALASSLDTLDSIQVLIPFGTVLVVPRVNSISLVSGYDPTNFAAQSYLASAGLGCKARRASDIVLTPSGGNEVWYLSDSGVMAFTGDNVSPRSLPLENLLAGRLLSPTAYPLAALLLHDRRAWLFAPGDAEADGNSTIYIWDSRNQMENGGWTRHDTAVVAGFTGGVSLSGASDGGELFLAGRDGQLYQYAGSADKATPEGEEQGIVCVATTRRMATVETGVGQQVRAMELWARVYYDGEGDTGTTLALTVQGDNQDNGNTWQGQTVVYPGERQFRKRVGSQARGRSLAVTLETTVTQPFALRAVELDYAVGTRLQRRT